MKVILLALNSKYIHTPLALWFLKSQIEGLSGISCEISDRTINEDQDNIIADVLSKKPDVLCFSVYIWNVDMIRKMVKVIKKAGDDPPRIVLGGPEVSFGVDENDDLRRYSDYIIRGEGELALKDYLLNGSRSDRFNVIDDLDILRSPYGEDELDKMGNRIVYYESSRGCPFKCSYCLSPATGRIRYFSLQRVMDDLSKILSHETGIIKFTDRTFNSDPKRAVQIVSFITEKNPKARIHFEITAHLLDDEIIDMFNSSKKGMFLLEMGIQSMNQTVLGAVGRSGFLNGAEEKIRRLITGGRVHVHLDLIAGLPYEDINSIKDSFDKLIKLKPHELQFGFLKLLKGAGINSQIEEHGYVFKTYPPYEIIKNRYLSFEQILKLKKIEKVFNRLYNSKLFIFSLDKLAGYYRDNVFQLFEELSEYFEENGYFQRSLPMKQLYSILYRFAGLRGIDLKEEILIDHLSTNRGYGLGKDFKPAENIKAQVFEKLSLLDKRFSHKSRQQILKEISFYPFSDGIRIFLHDTKDPLTGYYESMKL